MITREDTRKYIQVFYDKVNDHRNEMLINKKIDIYYAVTNGEISLSEGARQMSELFHSDVTDDDMRIILKVDGPDPEWKG